MVVVLEKPSEDKYDLGVSIADPFGSDINGYKKCAQDLREAISELVKTL